MEKEIVKILIEDCAELEHTNFEETANRILILFSVSNRLSDEQNSEIKKSFLAGYKKRAIASGLIYDEISELHATTLFKTWQSFNDC